MCGCLLHTPYWGRGLQPSHVPWTRNQTDHPLVHKLVLNPLSHSSQGCRTNFNSRKLGSDEN